MATRYEDLDWAIERYDDLEPGTPVEARINDVAIPVGTVGTVVRTIAETGNYQCVFDLDTGATRIWTGQRRVVAMCPDQIKPVGAPEVTDTLRLVTAQQDPVQHDHGDRRDSAATPLSADEAKRRRAEGLRAYHERRRAEKVAAEAEAVGDGDAPAASRRRGPRITGTPWSEQAKAAQSERMKARHAAKRAEAKAEAEAMVIPQEIEQDDRMTMAEVEAMRTTRHVPRTVRAVRAPSAWDWVTHGEQTTAATEDAVLPVAKPEEPVPPMVVRIVSSESEASDVRERVRQLRPAKTDWAVELDAVVRQMVADAAIDGTPEELAMLVGVVRHVAALRTGDRPA